MAKQILLAIDVGNTNIVLGLFLGDSLEHSFRLSSNQERTADDFCISFMNLLSLANMDARQISNVIISSVVPDIMRALQSAVHKFFGCNPIIAEAASLPFINIEYDDPRAVGADRLVNAVAGYALYGPRLILVDFGTATTFCVIGDNGDYLGGVIAPGLEISAHALFSRTAKLPKAEIKKPPSIIGTNTADSISSGLFYGYVGLVDNIVNKIITQTGWQHPTVVGCGGLATLIAPESQTIDKVDNSLTLTGLRLIFERLTTHEL